MLFAAARNDHVDCAIRPALDAGKWVVCDRFADSTRVYQGALGKVDPRLIKSLERVAVGNLAPSLTFILDLPGAGLARAQTTGRQCQARPFRGRGRGISRKLRQAYLVLAEREPRRCVVIDAGRGKEEVARQIWAVVRRTA